MNDSPAKPKPAAMGRQTARADISNAETATAEATEAARLAAPLVIPRASMRLKEFTNNSWKLVLPHGCTPEDLVNPGLWASVAHELRPYDDILAISSDAKWIATLLVADAVPTCAEVVPLQIVPLRSRFAGYETGLPPGHEIRRADIDDDLSGWVVIRTTDNIVLGRGLPSYEAARRHLTEHASLKKDGAVRYVP